MSHLGIFACLAIPFTFGTSMVPVKAYDGGDGLFAQFCMMIGLLLPAILCVFLVEVAPLYPFVMLGGGLYAIGNAVSLFIMEGTGMMLGSLLWNVSTCVVSWAVARFGLFGMVAEMPASPMMNYFSILTLAAGGLIFSRIENEKVMPKKNPYASRHTSTTEEVYTSFVKETDSCEMALAERECLNKSAEGSEEVSSQKRTICILLAVVVGCFYANMVLPINLLMKDEKNPQNPLAYIPSFAIGALLMGMLMFVVYTAKKKNFPVVNPNIILPAMTSGAIYGISVILLSIANKEVSQIIAFPIAAMSPGLINALWAIFKFKEIKGTRNFLLLAGAFSVSCLGIGLLALSKIEFGAAVEEVKF